MRCVSWLRIAHMPSFFFSAGTKIGPALLFFGCRHREKDFIYEEELLGFKATGALTALHVAFSRDQPQKDYVTHRLLANSKKHGISIVHLYLHC